MRSRPEDDSENEALPEVVAPALEPTLSIRERRLPPPINRHGEWRRVSNVHY